MKKQMRRMAAVVMACVMGVSLAGCGNPVKSGDKAAASGETAASGEAAASGGAAGSQAAADDGFHAELKLAHIMPIDHPNGLGAEEFARLVNEKTDGHVTVSVFPASQLGNEKEIFDAVEIGSIDFAIIGFGEPAKKYQDIGILDAPYIADDREHLVRILNSDVVASLFDSMEEHMGARGIGAFYYGARYLTTKDKPVTGPADMKGLNIRVPDQKLYIDTLTAMGAVATPMAFSEVFLSLQQGVIDGQENPLATIAANKFDQVQRYLIKTEHIMGANAIYAGTKTLDSLPDKYREAVLEAAGEAAAWIDDKAFEAEDTYIEQLKSNGMELIEDVDKEAFRQQTAFIYDEFDKTLVDRIHAVE